MASAKGSLSFLERWCDIEDHFELLESQKFRHFIKVLAFLALIGDGPNRLFGFD